MINILCFGDSNTYGYCHTAPDFRYSEEKRWVNILSVMLGNGFSVSAEGQNGRTTAFDWPPNPVPPIPEKNGLKILPEILGRQKEKTNLIIFMLGTNDCSFPFGLSPEEITYGMEKLIDAANNIETEKQGFSPKIILVSPPLILPDIEGTPFVNQIDKSSAEKSLALAPLYEELAERKNCIFLDAKDCEVNPLDCEHLTEKGHRHLAEKLYRAIMNIKF